MLKHLIVSFFILSTVFSFGDEEIRVHLETENQLSPLYLGHLQNTNAAFDRSYLAQLEAVMQYDINHSGSAQVMPRSAEKETLINAESAAKALHPHSWKTYGAHLVIKWSVSGKTLQASALTTSSGSLRQFTGIPLTGDLNQDRRQIHKLADAIHKAFFQKEGICNTRILFSYQVRNPRSDGSEWIAEIWECDWDGANTRQITHDGSYCISPVLVPPSSRYANDRFIYVSYKNGQPKIYLSSINDRSSKRLIDLGGNQLLPSISPNRDKIAFICDASGRTDLFIQPLNPETGEVGKPIQLFSYPRSTQASPTFSPDGSKIAFASDKDGGIRIYIIPSSTNGHRPQAKLISKQNRENSCPCWSPDGTKLAYSAKTGGIRQIWIYDIGSDYEWQLTSGPGNKENPFWAPDSCHLVFNSTDDTSSELYVVNLNQPEAIKITRGLGKKHYPTWGAK